MATAATRMRTPSSSSSSATGGNRMNHHPRRNRVGGNVHRYYNPNNNNHQGNSIPDSSLSSSVQLLKQKQPQRYDDSDDDDEENGDNHHESSITQSNPQNTSIEQAPLSPPPPPPMIDDDRDLHSPPPPHPSSKSHLLLPPIISDPAIITSSRTTTTSSSLTAYSLSTPPHLYWYRIVYRGVVSLVMSPSTRNDNKKSGAYVSYGEMIGSSYRLDIPVTTATTKSSSSSIRSSRRKNDKMTPDGTTPSSKFGEKRNLVSHRSFNNGSNRSLVSSGVVTPGSPAHSNATGASNFSSSSLSLPLQSNNRSFSNNNLTVSSIRQQKQQKQEKEQQEKYNMSNNGSTITVVRVDEVLTGGYAADAATTDKKPPSKQIPKNKKKTQQPPKTNNNNTTLDLSMNEEEEIDPNVSNFLNMSTLSAVDCISDDDAGDNNNDDTTNNEDSEYTPFKRRNKPSVTQIQPPNEEIIPNDDIETDNPFGYLLTSRPIISSSSKKNQKSSKKQHKSSKKQQQPLLAQPTPLSVIAQPSPPPSFHATGQFLYRVSSNSPLPILVGPANDAPSAKAMLLPNQIHTIELKIQFHDSPIIYLRLAHRRGWIPDRVFVANQEQAHQQPQQRSENGTPNNNNNNKERKRMVWLMTEIENDDATIGSLQSCARSRVSGTSSCMEPQRTRHIRRRRTKQPTTTTDRNRNHHVHPNLNGSVVGSTISANSRNSSNANSSHRRTTDHHHQQGSSNTNSLKFTTPNNNHKSNSLQQRNINDSSSTTQQQQYYPSEYSPTTTTTNLKGNLLLSSDYNNNNSSEFLSFTSSSSSSSSFLAEKLSKGGLTISPMMTLTEASTAISEEEEEDVQSHISVRNIGGNMSSNGCSGGITHGIHHDNDSNDNEGMCGSALNCACSENIQESLGVVVSNDTQHKDDNVTRKKKKEEDKRKPNVYLMRVRVPNGCKILDAPQFQVNNLIHGQVTSTFSLFCKPKKPSFSESSYHNDPHSPMSTFSKSSSIHSTSSSPHASLNNCSASSIFPMQVCHKDGNGPRFLPRGTIFEACQKIERGSLSDDKVAGLIKLADGSGWVMIPTQQVLEEQFQHLVSSANGTHTAGSGKNKENYQNTKGRGANGGAVEEVGNAIVSSDSSTLPFQRAGHHHSLSQQGRENDDNAQPLATWVRIVPRNGVLVSCPPPSLPPRSPHQLTKGSLATLSSLGSNREGINLLNSTNLGHFDSKLDSKSSDTASSIGGVSSVLDAMLFRSSSKSKLDPSADSSATVGSKRTVPKVPNEAVSSRATERNTVIQCGVCVEVDLWKESGNADKSVSDTQNFVRLVGGQGWIPRMMHGEVFAQTIPPPLIRHGSFWFRVQYRRGMKVRKGPSRTARPIQSEKGDSFRFECGEFLRASEVLTMEITDEKDEKNEESFAKLYRRSNFKKQASSRQNGTESSTSNPEKPVRLLSDITRPGEWIQVHTNSKFYLEECINAPSICRRQEGWRYNAMTDSGVVIRCGPSFAAEKTNKSLQEGESVLINERVKAHNEKVTWLRLKDGQGWVHDIGEDNDVVFMVAHSSRHQRIKSKASHVVIGNSDGGGKSNSSAVPYASNIMKRLFTNETVAPSNV